MPQIVGLAPHVGFAIVAADHEIAHPFRIAARIRDLERLAGTALHLGDQLLRRERRESSFETDGADGGVYSASDVERNGRATLLARERRLRIDRRFEIAGASQKTLDGISTVVGGIQGGNVSLVNRQLAHRAVPIAAAQSIKLDVGDAIVH